MDDFAQDLLATILVQVLEHCESVSARSLTVPVINSRDAGGCSGHQFLFLTRDLRALPACAVHSVGGFRRFPDTLAPDSPVAAYRLSCLGNPYRSSPLALSSDVAGRLARTSRRNRTVPRWIPAPLFGQACVSQHFRQPSHHSGGSRLRLKPGFSCSTNMDRSDSSSLTAPGRSQARGRRPACRQCSSGNSRVAAERSASVPIHAFPLRLLGKLLGSRNPCARLSMFSALSVESNSLQSPAAWSARKDAEDGLAL